MIRKVYSRRAGREVWSFEGRFNGRRVRRSGFATKAEAEEAFSVLRSRSRRAGLGLPTGEITSAIALLIDRLPRSPQNKPVIDQLYQLLSRIDESVSASAVAADITLEDLISARLQAARERLPRAERWRCEYVLQKWSRLLPAGLPVVSLEAGHLELYVRQRTADGLKPASVNRELNVIGAALHAARELFPALKQWNPPKIPRMKVSKGRRQRVFSYNEAGRLVAHLRRPRGQGEDYFKAKARQRIGEVLLTILLTGARPGEVHRLKVSDLDLDSGEILIRGTKTAHINPPDRRVPIASALMPVFKAAIEEGREYVFFKSGHAGPKYYRILRENCQEIGLPYGREALNGITGHDGRHTFTTRIIQSGQDLSTVGSITGHSDKYMTLYYTHATPESRARIKDAIEDLSERILSGEKADD